MSRLAEYRASRELLSNLTLRELRGKYKRSVLGWAWSLLNPLATMLVFSLVFGKILTGNVAPPTGGGRKGVFALYLMCALLPWNFFANVTSSGLGTLVAQGGLVRKVWFPREILILANTASMIVQFGIEMLLLVVGLLLFGNMALPWIPLALLLMTLLALFANGVALTLSAINVYFRDAGYLWAILVQLLFFLTPIVYPPKLAEQHLPPWAVRLYQANPMAVFTRAFRAALYELRFPSVWQFLYMVVAALASTVFGLFVFARLSPRFAEEL